MQAFKELLKNSKFVSLWASQMLSQLTVNLMNFLIITRLFTVTGSTIATSLLWLSYALPAIFFGPIGAASVDLLSRRKTLMITNFMQSLSVIAFILIHQNNTFLLYVLVLLYSFFNQFYIPAESSSLPSIVSKKHYPHANSLFFITQQASIILGFGVAGVLLGTLGFNGSLILCSIFLFVAFVSVSFLPEIKPRTKMPEAFDKLLLTFFRTIYDGYKYIKENKTILYPILLLLGVQVSLAMVIVILPLVATQILKVSVNLAGILVVVPAGIGALVGSLLISRNLRKTWRKKFVIESSAALLAMGLLFIIFLIPYLNVTWRVILEPVFMFIMGMGFVGMTIPTITFLQESTPTWLRGRVFGNFWFLSTIATVFPVLLSGVITEFFGVRTLLMFITLCAIFVFYFSKKHGQKLIADNF
jgi:MFS family permease